MSENFVKAFGIAPFALIDAQASGILRALDFGEARCSQQQEDWN